MRKWDLPAECHQEHIKSSDQRLLLGCLDMDSWGGIVLHDSRVAAPLFCFDIRVDSA